MPDKPHILRSFFPFTNGHVHTLYPRVFRPYPAIDYQRERLELPDGDFLDLDWHRKGHRQLCMVVHGLEGSADRYYVTGMLRAAAEHGFDGLGMNHRSCSGEMNRLPIFYHTGETGDIHTILEHVLATRDYERIVLVGFSMGGNQVLKYLGEDPDKVPGKVAGAACFSAPCELVGSAVELGRRRNAMYMRYFMKMLTGKMRIKHEKFPELINIEGMDKMRTFREFDERFTAPLNGFRDHMDYWTRSGARQFLRNIKLPTLLVNAANDSFLSDSCYPVDEADANPHLTLEIPRTGGHVGFVPLKGTHLYWSEFKAMEFFGRLD